MAEVYQAIEYIAHFPLSSAKLTENIRRKPVTRFFPFGVLYQIDNDTVVIIAIMNLKRKPFYWQSRIQ